MSKPLAFIGLRLLPLFVAGCSGDETPGPVGSDAGAATTSNGVTNTASATTAGAVGSATVTNGTSGPVTSGSTNAAASTGVTNTTSGVDGVTNTTSGVGGATNTTDGVGGATNTTSGLGGAGATTSGAGGVTNTTGGTGGTSSTTSGSGGTGGGDVDDGDCMTPPVAPPLIGWASEAGGTVGGGNATPTVVTSAGDFNAAIAGNDARVIHVNGSLSGSFSIGSNKTIIGVCGAELRGSVSISGQQNIVLRNINVIGNDCDDSPGNCSGGADAIGVRSSHHLWFDHLTVSDGSDGNLDMTNNSDYITISWTKFFYSTARTDPEQGASGHRFSNLIAGSDSDSGEYRITFHHNWWAENVDQRMPRARFGDIHVFNNLFTSSGNSYCTNAGFQTRVLVENNIYRGVNNPLSPDANGDMRAAGNVFDDTTGNQSDNGGTGFDPPYDYVLDPTSGLDTLLQAEVGPQD